MKTTTCIATLISFFCLLTACSAQKEQTKETKEQEENRSKLEQFLQLPTDSVYALCNLSNDSIAEFPDLSAYTIRKLDLSYNQIDLLIEEFFPKGLRRLDVSHNSLIDVAIKSIEDDSINEIDLSYNRIKNADIFYHIKRLDLSYNDLYSVGIYTSRIHFLNISNNTNLSNVMEFWPHLVDTIIHNNIATDEPLKYVSYNDIM